jgi:hypothetical protein
MQVTNARDIDQLFIIDYVICKYGLTINYTTVNAVSLNQIKETAFNVEIT